MKTIRHYFFAAVLCVVLSGLAGGQIERPVEHEAGLIGRVNPTLAGISEVSVVIKPSDGEPNKDGLLWEQIDAKVQEKLGKSGVKVKPVRLLSRPELIIAVDVLRVGESPAYVFHVQTSLARRVVLDSERQVHLKPDVWKAKPVMAAAAVEDMQGKITEAVLAQVESFVTCLLTANPDGFVAADANGADVARLARKTNSAKLVARGRYRYVASKKSKVFHRADCMWAQRIKPENLIGFNSREEAIRSGRRPCRRCGQQVERRGR